MHVKVDPEVFKDLLTQFLRISVTLRTVVKMDILLDVTNKQLGSDSKQILCPSIVLDTRGGMK